MKYNRNTFFVLALGLLLLIAATPLLFREQVHAQRRPNPAIALYNQPEISDPDARALRKVRDAHFERFVFGLPSLDQLPTGGTTDCFAPGVRERLAAEKDTVLIGGIIDAHAHLNSTKQHVYTEYQVRVEQVLKNEGDGLSTGKEIVASRWGGEIQFLDGEVRQYWVRKLGMPEIGRRYLFFLERQKDGGDFYIWTAFRFNSDSITVIDDLDSKLFPLAAYKGSNEVGFISQVRRFLALAASRKKQRKLTMKQ